MELGAGGTFGEQHSGQVAVRGSAAESYLGRVMPSETTHVVGANQLRGTRVKYEPSRLNAPCAAVVAGSLATAPTTMRTGRSIAATRTALPLRSAWMLAATTPLTTAPLAEQPTRALFYSDDAYGIVPTCEYPEEFIGEGTRLSPAGALSGAATSRSPAPPAGPAAT